MSAQFAGLIHCFIINKITLRQLPVARQDDEKRAAFPVPSAAAS